jgi:hypothetical protein
MLVLTVLLSVLARLYVVTHAVLGMSVLTGVCVQCDKPHMTGNCSHNACVCEANWKFVSEDVLSRAYVCDRVQVNKRCDVCDDLHLGPNCNCTIASDCGAPTDRGACNNNGYDEECWCTCVV